MLVLKLFFRHIKNCSQGGVKIPTGGIVRERQFTLCSWVSRSGETPEPTVIVRMEDNG